MNPLIKGRLPADYQLLWQLTKKQRLSGDLGNMIQAQVKQVRKNFRTSKRDPLFEKYLNFGNDGLWSANKLRELSHAIFDNKGPDRINLGEWISVEIECVMPSEEAEMNFIKFIRKHKLQKSITIKNDGSIRTISPVRRPDERRMTDQQRLAAMANTPNQALEEERQRTRTAYGREIVMTFRYGDWSYVKKVCGEMNRQKFFVNQSCGMHVHFDCRHVTIEDAVRLGKRIAYAVPALKQILPRSRWDNRFCAVDINDVNGGDQRYAFVNLQSYHRHQTIEIRGHSGTTDSVKIVNWIRILKKIMDKRSRKYVKTASELINAYKLESDLIEYINMRFEKFNKPIEVPAEMATLDDVEVDDAYLMQGPDEIMNMEPPMQTAVNEAAQAETRRTIVMGHVQTPTIIRPIPVEADVAHDEETDEF